MKTQNLTQEFHSAEFGSLEILMINGRPYFPAKDCAEKLGYAKSRNAIDRHCKGALKRGVPTNGGIQEKTFIPEGDLYRLIVRSKLPAAERFETWVFDELLPCIRKHGFYATDDTLDEMLRSPDFAEHLIRKLAEERTKSAALEELAGELTPKAKYCDIILLSKSVVPVSLIAKDYGLSALTFNRLLRRLGIQYRVGGTWVLYQSHAGKGYTQTRTYIVGDNTVALHTCWTQRGRLFLYETLKKRNILPLIEQRVATS